MDGYICRGNFKIYKDLGLSVFQILGFRVQGLGCQVWGSGLKILLMETMYGSRLELLCFAFMAMHSFGML